VPFLVLKAKFVLGIANSKKRKKEVAYLIAILEWIRGAMIWVFIQTRRVLDFSGNFSVPKKFPFSFIPSIKSNMAPDNSWLTD